MATCSTDPAILRLARAIARQAAREDHEREQRLFEMALAVRRKLEKFGREHPHDRLGDFPNGACGDASELLGRYLIEHGFKDVLYRLGRKETCSHAWLTVGGVIVDITADQFGLPPVIVTAESEWHAKWALAQVPRPPAMDATGCPAYPAAGWAAINEN